MLDKRDVGGGSTSASTALLQYEIDMPLVELSTRIGRRDAEECYRYTTRQYKSITINHLWDRPTSVPEIFGDEHGVFHGLKLQEIFPSASPDTAAKGGQAE